MANIDSEMLAVIKYATTMEIGGRSFYEHVADVTENKLGKKMFRKLAEDESVHLKTFGDMFTDILGSEEWKKYLNQEEYKKDTVVQELKERIEKQGTKGHASELEALRIGMELERKSIDHYEKAAKEAKEAKAKEVFSKIIKEEMYHYDLLQAQYDNITGSGFWFDIAEFKMDAKY